MPGDDRTGPMGQGPMTGRGAGYCSGASMPGFANPVPGRGFGRGGFGRGSWGGGGGRGGGRGRRNWFYATGIPGWARGGWGFGPHTPYDTSLAPSATKEQEMELLREQAKHFNDALDDIKERIDELSAKEKEN